MNNECIKHIIRKSLKEFSNKDKDTLLKYGVYELTMGHRIAVYLENEFYGYSVDCEYNKMVYDPKINSQGKKVRPDIIIHKRGKRII